MKEKDLLLISKFRFNAREPLTSISKQTKIPISTIFDKLKIYEEEIITKMTCLIDFKKIGYQIRTQLLIKTEQKYKEKFLQFLKMSEVINNVYKINNGFDFLAEAIFEDIDSLNSFYDKIEEYHIEKKEEFFIMEEIVREKFLSTSELLPQKKLTNNI